MTKEEVEEILAKEYNPHGMKFENIDSDSKHGPITEETTEEDILDALHEYNYLLRYKS